MTESAPTMFGLNHIVPMSPQTPIIKNSKITLSVFFTIDSDLKGEVNSILNS